MRSPVYLGDFTFDYNYRANCPTIERTFFPSKFLSLNRSRQFPRLDNYRISRFEFRGRGWKLLALDRREVSALAPPPKMVIDADRERSVNRKLGVEAINTRRWDARQSTRLDSTRLESGRGEEGGASLIRVSKSSSGIQGRAVYKGVGVRDRRNGERNVKASILGGRGRRKFGRGKRVFRASFEEPSYRAQSARWRVYARCIPTVGYIARLVGYIQIVGQSFFVTVSVTAPCRIVSTSSSSSSSSCFLFPSFSRKRKCETIETSGEE